MKYLIIVTLFLFSCAKESTYRPEVNGVTLEGASSVLSYNEYQKVDSLAPNYVAIIPFAYLTSSNHSNLIQYPSWQWWGEDTIGVVETIQMAHKTHHKVMIKPQLWIRPAFFTGDYKCSTETEWKEFEKGYKNYLLAYAKIAQKHHAEILCIGNELKEFVKARPLFWKELITDVRAIYSGKITYAANWDNYQEIPFWSEIDFIGINAYFPLSESSEPSVNELNKCWEGVKGDIANLSNKFDKKVLFTEYGYRSITGTTDKPWESYTEAQFSDKAQRNAYQSFYETFWGSEFVEGGFLWKWRVNGTISPTDKSYSVFGKSAGEVVREFYSK